MAADVLLAPVKSQPLISARRVRRTVKRLVPLVLALYFIPIPSAIFFCFGLLDYLRNTQRTLGSFDRYFAGNGLLTWILAPFNLFVDLLAFPYRNKGIYELADLPQAYQDEIQDMVRSAYACDLMGQVREKMGDNPRGMVFFKWYGQNVQTSVDAPDFHKPYQFIRTIGLSIFNSKQSTGKHFGPLRTTLRVLYNLNDTVSDQVYIKVGNHVNRWRDQKLFIFDDTLQHQSCNESDQVRYCMFVDILRPSYLPRVMDAILGCVRTLMFRFSGSFYRHWTFIK